MAHKSYAEMLDALLDAQLLIGEGELYQHSKSGARYQVVGFTIMEATDEVGVRYCPLDQEEVEITRPIREFQEVIEINGMPMPRFERVPS